MQNDPADAPVYRAKKDRSCFSQMPVPPRARSRLLVLVVKITGPHRI